MKKGYFWFGKYRETPIGEIDAEYLEWVSQRYESPNRWLRGRARALAAEELRRRTARKRDHLESIEEILIRTSLS